MSDTGAALFGVDDTMTAITSHRYENRTLNRNGSRVFASSAVSHGQGSNDIDLPELKSPNYNFESSDMSLGDLSPIKLIYSEGSPPKIERRAESHSTDTYNTKGSDFDWRSDEINVSYPSNRSNPFYVLRSANKAFASLRYLLPCLRLPPSETNTITMSNFGSIRQYKSAMVRFQASKLKISVNASFFLLDVTGFSNAGK